MLFTPRQGRCPVSSLVPAGALANVHHSTRHNAKTRERVPQDRQVRVTPSCSLNTPEPVDFSTPHLAPASASFGGTKAATAVASPALDYRHPLLVKKLCCCKTVCCKQDKNPLSPVTEKLSNHTMQRLQNLCAEVALFTTRHDELLVVSASTLLCSLSHSALRPVLPMFTKSFGVGTAAVGMTVSFYALARLMTNLPAGILADRHGRQLLLVWGPAVTALGMFGCGRARSFQHLLAWRWVTGLGSALQMSGSQLYLADISKTSTRAQCLGTNQAASQIGSFLGPMLGGVVADQAGLRAPFTLAAAAALLASLCTILNLPANISQHREVDPGSMWPNSKRGQPSKAKGKMIAKPSQALGTKPEWQQLLLCRNFGSIALVSAVMFMTQNGARAVLLPLLAMQGFGMSARVLGATFSAMAILNLIVVLPAALAADKLGRKWTIIPSCVSMAAALSLLALLGDCHGFFMYMALYAFSNACIGANLVAYATEVMPANLGGFGLGLYRCAGDLGMMLGPMLLGWIADVSSVRVALQVNAALLVLAVAYFGIVASESNLQQR